MLMFDTDDMANGHSSGQVSDAVRDFIHSFLKVRCDNDGERLGKIDEYINENGKSKKM